jgi:PKD repeat protein
MRRIFLGAYQSLKDKECLSGKVNMKKINNTKIPIKWQTILFLVFTVLFYLHVDRVFADYPEILYLRDQNILSIDKGDPVPWVSWRIYPDLAPVIWQTSLEGDISEIFDYSIDIVGSQYPAQLNVEFIIDQNGRKTTVASDSFNVGTINEGSEYTTISPLQPITGVDLQTKDGDKLIFQISCELNYDAYVAIGLDGQDDWSDSNIQIEYQGPLACFTANPLKGDLLTQFEFNASCSSDETYESGDLQVRWDWEDDGSYDTAYSTEKTASHTYNSAGIKSVKLQVKNPDGITRTNIKTVEIPAIILHSFPAGGPAPFGLTWDGSYLWLSDVYDNTITQLNPSGEVVKTIPSPCDLPFDLAWDGTNLWTINAAGGSDPGSTLYKIQPSGEVTTIDLPSDFSHGLTWDGHFLWASDRTQGRIAQINSSNGNILKSFQSPGPEPYGLAWDGQYLWNADAFTKNLYQIDVNGNLLNTWSAPGTGPRGLTWDGSNLWCVDTDSFEVYKLADKIPTTIAAKLSKTSLTLGELPIVSGQISPSPGEAGKGVSIELIPPTGATIYEAALADINGEFDFQLGCGDLHRAGTWIVRTSWEGSGPYEGSISQDHTLVVSKAASRVTLDISSHAIRLDDNEKVSISGKFTPKPDCGSGLEGIPIKLVITGPSGTDTQTVNTNDQWGHFLLKDYAGFNALGEWTIQAQFAGNAAYLASTSDPIEVRVVESAGYALIVQGKISSEEGLASHNKSTKFVYDTLRDRGLLEDDIQYFNYDTSQEGVDGIPTKTAIQNAITQWARGKMNAKPANLYIIMVDHGLEDVFYIFPEKISSSELSHWLDALQAGLTGQAASQEIITILGFCRSGSFIDNLAAANRVTIASAAADESSYKGPLDEDNIREGEYFIAEFFKSVSFGKSVKTAFEKATLLTEVFTSSGTGDSTNAPYFDESLQHPLLDDNGDGWGSNELAGQGNGDGSLSQEIFIGVSSITGNAPGDVQVTQVSKQQFLGVGDTSVNLLWAQVDNDSRLLTIWVEVKPPGYAPADPGGSGQAEWQLSKNTYDDSNASMQRYEWTNLGGFVDPGTYQIFYFAKDDLSENVSPLMASTVYKAKSGNTPPKMFNLTSPAEGASVLTSVLLEWQDTSDPEGDQLSYTVLLSRDDMAFNSPIRKEGLQYSACVITAEDGLEDLSTYYWKVQAIDEFGAIRETGVGMFYTNNTNPVAGWIKGHVYDGATGKPLTNAALLIGNTSLNTAAGGYYLGVLSPGNYTVTVSAGGYVSRTIAGVMVPEGTIVSQDISLTPQSPDEVKAFVTRFYQLCLGRGPDPVGLEGWVTALMDGSQTGSDVAYGFVFSPEFLERQTTNDEYLQILYQAFFNRDPDPAGWAGWMAELNKGTHREHVLKGFIYAKEFNELCRTYGIMPNPVAAFVTRFYQLCLKRNPDIAGLDGWVASLLNGANVGADVAEGFIFSPEFTRSVMSDEEYMRILYKAFFNRDPDAVGLAGWLEVLNGGTTRIEVLNGFIYSKEFGELCQQYGIRPFR